MDTPPISQEDLEVALQAPITRVNYHRGQLAATASTARILLILGGNRSGKTEWGSIEAISHCLGYRPWLAPSHPLYKTYRQPLALTEHTPIKCRIFGEDLKKSIGQVLWPKLERYIPKHEVVYIKRDNNTSIPIHIEFRGGSTIDMVSYDMDVDASESTDTDYAWFDEPPMRSLFIAVWRGLTDRQGLCRITATPLKEPWLISEIFSQAWQVSRFAADSADDIVEQQSGAVKHNIEAFVWHTNANIGFGLTAQAVEELAEMLDPEERETRLGGTPRHYHGRVFKNFSRPAHVVINGHLDATRPYTFYETIDPHTRTRHAVGFWAVGQNGIPVKFDEIWEHQGKEACSAEELAQLIINRRKATPAITICDPSWAFSTENNEISFIDKLEVASGGRIACEKGSKNRDAANLAIKEALRVVNDFPGLKLFDCCRRTIWEYENWVYEEPSNSRLADRRELPGRGIDKNDHFIEGDGRLLLLGMRFIPEAAYFPSGMPYLDDEDEADSAKDEFETRFASRSAKTGA